MDDIKSNIYLKKLIKNMSDNEIEFIKENDIGHIEYKLRLDTKNNIGLNKLESQMKWRLSQSKNISNIYEAHYLLGVEDDGTLGKLTKNELKITYDIFISTVKKCNAYLNELFEYKIGTSNIIYAIINKKIISKINEISMAFIGPSMCGKTTSISYLTYGKLDNGNGSARQYILQHPHEKMTGLTSSIKKEIIGLNNGNIVNFSCCIETSPENIVESSDLIINLIDLPGNDKFSKTLYYGLLTYKINLIAIVVSDAQMNIEFYIYIAKEMNIPFIILITKNDNIQKPIYISKYNCPIIEVTNITGNGYDNLISYLHDFSIQQNNLVESNNLVKTTSINEMNNSLFTIIELYYIPDTGIILSGIVDVGTFEIGDNIYVTDGKIYNNAIIKSIHKKQVDSKFLYEKETGCLCIKCNTSNINIDMCKKMIVCKKMYKLINCVTIKTNKHIELKEKHQCMLYIGNISCSVIITSINKINNSIYITLDIVDNNIIIPKMNYNINVIAVLKSEKNKICIGTIYE